MTVFMIGVRIGSVGHVKSPDSILIGWGYRHCPHRTVLNHLENSLVEIRMGVMGHYLTLPSWISKDEVHLDQPIGSFCTRF
jgi:hypothetical protein